MANDSKKCLLCNKKKLWYYKNMNQQKDDNTRVFEMPKNVGLYKDIAALD